MSQPQQPGNWSDPSWPSHQSPAGYPATDQQPTGYGVPGQPPAGYPATGYPPAGYAAPGYLYPPPAPMPMNGRAIAALVLGVLGILGLCGYLVPGLIGIVGALLGHSARRQIRTAAEQGRPEQGDGMALAGMITGWIAFGLGLAGAVLVTVAIAASISQG